MTPVLPDVNLVIYDFDNHEKFLKPKTPKTEEKLSFHTFPPYYSLFNTKPNLLSRIRMIRRGIVGDRKARAHYFIF